MALDFIAWAPEVQFLIVMLGLLYYGTGPAVTPVTEALWVPSGWTQSKPQGPKLDKPSAGPDYIPSHLTSWAIVTCLVSAWLIWDSPLPVLQAGGAFIRDPFTQIMGGFLMVFAAACLAAANGWLQKAHVIHPEYIVLVLLAILGQHLLIMTSDLMALYLCLELQSFALVVLCSLNYTSPYAIEAGMKYFLLSAFSSCLLLLGIGLIYWETGLTRCSHIQELLAADLEPNLTLWLGLWLVGVGLLWKLAAAPLHMWAADVYQGAWTSVTLLISTLPKISVLAFWVHSWHSLWTTAFGEAMAIFSALSLIVGALAPMAQSQLKRLLAFSSISHMGFLLIPLVQGTEGLSALWAYLILYLLTNLALWGLMLWPFARGKFSSAGPQSIWDLAGLNSYMPVAATAWAGGMLSLAGLPPVAGFLGKLGIFWWGLNQQQYALMTLALVATLLSTVYYLRVLKVAYVDQPKSWGQFDSLAPMNAYLIAIAWFSLAVLLWHGTPLVLASHLMALACSFFFLRFFKTIIRIDLEIMNL